MAGPARPVGGSGQRVDEWRGVQFAVRAIPAQAAVKRYRCPGCDQEIALGLAHLVAWPVDDLDGADRRHWHGVCWAARARRGPEQLRPRNAPRY